MSRGVHGSSDRSTLQCRKAHKADEQHAAVPSDECCSMVEPHSVAGVHSDPNRGRLDFDAIVHTSQKHGLSARKVQDFWAQKSNFRCGKSDFFFSKKRLWLEKVLLKSFALTLYWGGVLE